MKIFITGVSSGIGHALAQSYLDRGFEVYGVSRRAPEDLLKAPRFSFKPLDLLNTETIHPTLSELLVAVNNLDLVILNAGIIGKSGDVNDLSLADFQHVMNVNVWANKVILDSLFSTCHNIKQVVAISSGAAIAAVRGSAGYCMSKIALNMLIALYAEERGKTHFSALAPCLVKTPMQDQLTSQPADSRFPAFEFLKMMRDSGRMLEPNEAAQHLMAAIDQAPTRPTGSFIDASKVSKPGVLSRLNPFHA